MKRFLFVIVCLVCIALSNAAYDASWSSVYNDILRFLKVHCSVSRIAATPDMGLLEDDIPHDVSECVSAELYGDIAGDLEKAWKLGRDIGRCLLKHCHFLEKLTGVPEVLGEVIQKGN